MNGLELLLLRKHRVAVAPFDRGELAQSNERELAYTLERGDGANRLDLLRIER